MRRLCTLQAIPLADKEEFHVLHVTNAIDLLKLRLSQINTSHHGLGFIKANNLKWAKGRAIGLSVFICLFNWYAGVGHMLTWSPPPNSSQKKEKKIQTEKAR